MVISEFVFCAVRRTGIAGTPNKTLVVKNDNVPDLMMPPRGFILSARFRI
jgi:hypothetical protein